MTFVIGLGLLSLCVVAGVGFFVGLSSGANAQCGDCLDHEAARSKQAGELRDLSAANGTLSKALAYWMGRAQTAEQRVNELFMEAQEDAALARELDAWKKDIDPRLLNLTPEQVERLYEKIMEGVKPSPAQHYDSVSALIRSTGARP